MKCGQSEAQVRKYKKITGKSGRIWLVAIQPNEADNIYVSASPKENTPGYGGFRGFGGATLSFELEDGTTIDLQGLWHSNSGALYNDTGYDIRNKHKTFGVIGLGREYRKGMGQVTITDVIYKDDDWVIGSFGRAKKIAQNLANTLGKQVMCFSKSQGGSSCGVVKPEEQNE
jgi:hypothetical protein